MSAIRCACVFVWRQTVLIRFCFFLQIKIDKIINMYNIYTKNM